MKNDMLYYWHGNRMFERPFQYFIPQTMCMLSSKLFTEKRSLHDLTKRPRDADWSPSGGVGVGLGRPRGGHSDSAILVAAPE
jgi:hypothetical protein